MPGKRKSVDKRHPVQSGMDVQATGIVMAAAAILLFYGLHAGKSS